MSLNGVVNVSVQLGPCIGGLLYFGSANGARGTGQSLFPLIMLVRYISHHCVPVFKSSTFFPILLHRLECDRFLKYLELDC